MQRPLTALILLAAACSSRDGTVLDDTGRGAGSSANALELGPIQSAVALDALPACADVEPGGVYFVDAPSNKLGFYSCDSEGAWQLVGVPVDAGSSAAEHATLATVAGLAVAVGVDDNGNGTLDPEEIDAAGTLCNPSAPDAGVPAGDGGTTEPAPADAGTTEPPVVDAGPPPPPPPPPLGACLECARNTCPLQYANAIGADSSAENLALVDQLLSCVIGPDWAAGGAIPADSCFFAEPAQPAGTLIPCYCGSTPTATCLATGPVDNSDACGREVELASGCSTITASCVTSSGSNPAVALGDTLQLFNCERVACQAECGFPTPIEE
jgi:hypothetical protein